MKKLGALPHGVQQGALLFQIPASSRSPGNQSNLEGVGRAVATGVHQNGAGRGQSADTVNRFGLGDGRGSFAVVVTRGRVGAHRVVAVLAVRATRLGAGRAAVGTDVDVHRGEAVTSRL